MADTPTLELRIQDNSEKAIQGLQSLAASLSSLKQTLDISAGLTRTTIAIAQLSAKLSGAFNTDTVNNLTKTANALERIAKYSNGISGGNGLGSIGGLTPQNSETGFIKPELTGTADAEEKLVKATDALNSVVETAKEQISAYDTELQKYKELAGQAAEATKKHAREVDNTGKRFSGLVKSIGKVFSPLNKVAKAFGRIMFYRAIRSVLRQIAQGFSEGLQNVREYSKAIGGTFNTAMTSAENALLKMKNSIGAAFAPALEALIPIMQTVVSWFIELINYANQFISLITGKEQWTKAIDASAESLEKTKKTAGGAAKKVKELLAGFDELNIIQSESGSGSGGSGSGSSVSYTDMFTEETEFDTRIKAIVTWIKDNGPLVLDIVRSIGFAFATWKISRAFGAELGTSIKYALGLGIAFFGAKKAYEAFIDQWDNGVDLSNMKELLKGLSLFVIGLGIAFGGIGFGIGLIVSGVALAINPLKELIETGELSKEAMQQLGIAAALVGAGIVTLATGSIKAGIGMGIAIYGFVSALQDLKDQWDNGVTVENMSSMFKKLGIMVLGAGFAFGTKGFGAAAVVAGLAAIVEPLKEFVETGSMSDEAFTQLELGIAAISGGLTAITGNWHILLIGGIIAGIAWLVKNWERLPTIWEDVVVPWVKQAIADVKQWATDIWENFKKDHPEIVQFWEGTIVPWVNDAVGMITGWLTTIWNNFEKDHPEIAGFLKEVWQVIKTFVSGIKSLIKDPKGTVKGWWDAVVGWFNGSSIKEFLDDPWNTIIGWWDSLVEWWNGVIEANPFLKGVTDVINDIVAFLTRAWNFIEGIWNDPGQAMVDMMQFFLDLGTTISTGLEQLWMDNVYNNPTLGPIAKFFESFINGVKEFLADPGNVIKGWWDSLVDWWNKTVDANPFLKGARDVINDIVDFLTQAWKFIEGIWNDPGQAMVDMLQFFLDLGTTISTGLEQFWMDNVYNDPALGPIVKFVEKAVNTIGEILSDPGAWFSNIWVNIKGSLSELWDDKIVPYVTQKWNEFLEQPVVKPIADFVRNAIKTVEEVAQDPFGYVTQKFNEFTSSLSAAWSGFIATLKEDKFLGPIIETLEDALPRIIAFINNPIATVEAAWENLKTWFHNTIAVPFTNFFIDFANNAIDVVNNIIDAINSFSFDAFGQHVGFNIPRLERIERLEEEVVPEEPIEVPVVPVLNDEDTGIIMPDYFYDPENDVEITFDYAGDELENIVLPAPDTSEMTTALDNSVTTVTKDVDEIVRQFDRLGSRYFSTMFSIGAGGGGGGGRFGHIALRADGGFVSNGDMFIAREAGPELVGRIGSRTAVANNDQIVAGVANGVAAGQEEQNALLRRQNDILVRLLNKELSVKLTPSSGWGSFIRSSEEMYADNAGY